VERRLLYCQNLQRKKEKKDLEFTLECRQPQCGFSSRNASRFLPRIEAARSLWAADFILL
jgi:hypothetical protein